MKKTFLIILAAALIFATVSCDAETLRKLADLTGKGQTSLFVKPSMEVVNETTNTIDKLTDEIRNLGSLKDLIQIKDNPQEAGKIFDFNPDIKDLVDDIKNQAGAITNPEQIAKLRKEMKEPVPDEIADAISKKVDDLRQSLDGLQEQMDDLLGKAEQAIASADLPPETKEFLGNLKEELNDTVQIIISDIIPHLERETATMADLASGVLLIGFADSVQEMVMPMMASFQGGVSGDAGELANQLIGPVTELYDGLYATSKALENINEPGSAVGECVNGALDMVNKLIQNLPKLQKSEGK